MTMTEPDIEDTLRPRRDRTNAPDSADLANSASSAILPERLLLKFGSSRARPRLLQIYDPKTGWSTDRKRALVTIALLNELRGAGITLVEAKWRNHRRQINLSTLDTWSQA
jgi:hypothetical protein